ncbi:hypothetical protein PQZ67_gp01 [Escherichia phage ZCEC13]|nr:hypothetical protein PQZ67_gp01 [Escherichia phage ZCEC13]
MLTSKTYDCECKFTTPIARVFRGKMRC